MTRPGPIGEIKPRKMTWDDASVGFQCSKPEFAEYFAVQAMYDQTHQIGQPYVFAQDGQIVGYVVLSMDRLDMKKEVLGIDAFGNIPALLIGHLATDARYERRCVGSTMVEWSIAYARRLSRIVGCRVAAVNSELDVVEFYEKLGFKEISKNYTMQNDRGTVDMYIDIKEA